MEHMKEIPEANKVNQVLQFPGAKTFERDLTARLNENEQVTIVMIDLDSFLLVNNRYGHDEGDRVLIETGHYIKSAVPENVTVYRYGGDAFSLIYPADYEKEDVFLSMEKLRAAYLVQMADGYKVTISAGIASSPEDSAQYTELVRKAEGAMCRGKMAGRDRVCLAREEKMVVKTSHYTADQLQRLTKLSKREGTSEAILLREALDGLLKKYDV